MNLICEVFGKWILTGEHTVLRGGGALVFPFKGRSLKLYFEDVKSSTTTALNLTVSGAYGEEYKLLFWGVFEKALQMKALQHNQFSGNFHLEAELPIGAGLGASATLCVAIVRWMMNKSLLQETESLEFARQLENLFHGESSGVDVAVALRGQPILFHRGEQPTLLNFQNLNDYHWAISYCGQRGITADCIQKVKNLIFNQPEKAQKIDEQMKASVRLALKGFQEKNIQDLIQSLELGQNCFQQWNLTEGVLEEHMNELKKIGALAVKPTGSGGGGYVLSLWSKSTFQNQKSSIEFFSCF